MQILDKHSVEIGKDFSTKCLVRYCGTQRVSGLSFPNTLMHISSKRFFLQCQKASRAPDNTNLPALGLVVYKLCAQRALRPHLPCIW